MTRARLANSRWLRRFWDVAGAASVRVKVMGIVLGVILLLGLVITIQMRVALTAALERQLERQGEVIAEHIASVAGQLLHHGEGDAVGPLLEDSRRHYTGEGHNTRVDYIVVEAEPGASLLTSRSPRWTGAALPLWMSGTGSRRRDTPFGTLTEITVPLSYDMGRLRLGLAEDNIRVTVDSITGQILTLTLGMVGVGFAAAFFLTWILTRPILSLVDAARGVARGDLTRRVPRWANDEIGDLADAFNAMTHSLAESERERAERDALRERYVRAVIGAQEEERKRIARELHDSTSQSLTSLLIGLRNLEQVTDPDALEHRIEDIRRVVNHTLEEVHALAWQLRPSVLDDLGLVAALDRYVADFKRRYPVHVDFVGRGIDGRLPATVETTAYRLVQEALTNIARHADARHASVLIELRGDTLRVLVEDDGRGFDLDAVEGGGKHLGLQGMRERAQLLGGSVTVESHAGVGTTVFAQLPLHTTATTPSLEALP